MKNSAQTRLLVALTASASLCAGTLPRISLASSGGPLEVYRMHPQRIGVGSAIVKLARGLKKPEVYEVMLDANDVNHFLPEVMEPRLIREDTPKLGKVLLSPGFLNTVKKILREVREKSPITDSTGLAGLFEESVSHTYTITNDRLTFAVTGPDRTLELISKHAIISSNFEEVHFAGQMWLENGKLCVNGNSGTYVKKRKAAGLTDSPDLDLALKVIAPLFSPALEVTECREVAPGYGESEAIDQAEKAEAAANDAEAKLRDASPAIEAARAAARAAREASAEAHTATAAQKENRSAYLAADLKAAEASAAAKKARKKLEKLMKLAE